MKSDARAIYQSVLDKLTAAIMGGHTDVWLRHVQVPHIMSTIDGRTVHETEADVLTGFGDFRNALARLKVIRLERSCDTARMTKGDTIVGFHTAKMTKEDGSTLPPYPARWVLHLADGDWKVAKSNSALSAANWSEVPHHSISDFTGSGSDLEMARRELLQSVMDRIDAVYISGDFDGWRDSVCLPLVFETRTGHGVFNTEDALRRDFELYQDEFRIHQITELTRVVKTADVIDDGMMLGTYRVHVLSGSTYVVPPWDGAMTLKLVDGRWRVTKLMGALGHLNWNSNAGGGSPDTNVRDYH